MGHDPRLPAREECVLRYLVDSYGEHRPDAEFARFADGTRWCYSDLRREVATTAAGLHAIGVRQGDHVVCWLPNGVEAVRFWFAINYLGGVYVPINTAYRGTVLRHVLTNADARVMVASGELVDRLEPGHCGRIDQLVLVGDAAAKVAGMRVVSADAVRSDSCPPLDAPVEPWDTQAILYTSGTTGPSKGVLSSYMQSWAMFGPQTMPFVTADDRYLINMPLFHVGGTGLLYSMLLRGASVAVIDRFSVSRFWTQVRDMRATVVFLLGVMASFVDRTPHRDDDRDHPLRTVLMVPLVEDVAAFVDRFGVDVYSIYNMTELSAPLITERNPTLPGTCGRVRPGVEVRLLDSNDCEVPIGSVGEIAVRTDAPWALNHGYYAMPEATAAAWRNGWFHTGDLARRDEAGNFFFVDRLKDSIRRRGENISSMEVEAEIYANPKIREVAVIAVPSEYAEDEVMAVVSLVDGAVLDPVELVDFLRPRVPYFAIPRYIRVVDEIPKTPTSKISKMPLRQEGVTPDTWDRELAGVVVTRND